MMRMQDLDDTIFPDLAPQAHEAFSSLGRRLRAIDLPYGLTNERLSTLATVAGHKSISVSTLAAVEIVSVPTMSRMIDALEAKGFVRRRHDKIDTRSVLVSITAKGRRAYQRATQQSLSHLIGTLNTLVPGQLAAISTLLAALDGPQLSERATEVERLYAIAPVGLCYIDKDLRFRYINTWLARLNGIPVEAHIGEKIGDVLTKIADIVVPQLRQVLQTGEPIFEGEVTAETPARPGESRHFIHNYYPDRGRDGTVVGVSCLVYDITERIEMESESRPRL